MVWKLIRITISLIIDVSQHLFINMFRHMCIVFLPNPPIAISNLPYCSSHGLTDMIGNFPKTLLLVSWAKYNTHVTVIEGPDLLINVD